jgi:hypothetical protein
VISKVVKKFVFQLEAQGVSGAARSHLPLLILPVPRGNQ